MDFGALKDLKATLECTFDHTLVLDAKDPQLDLFRQLAVLDAAQIVIMDDGVGIEKFAKRVYEISNEFILKKTNSRVWVSMVEVWEHEKNSAIYSNANTETAADIGEEVKNVSTFEMPLHAEEIKLEVPVTETARKDDGVRVGSGPVTKGWSNPFAGTSWGM